MYEEGASGDAVTSRIYRDEPIPRTAALLAGATPPEYREMRKLARSYSIYENSEAIIFYKQGKFMEEFEDDFDFGGEFVRYFPTYQAMNDRQLRGYFSWRTRVRRGIVEKTSLSFAFVYLYELLNQIGTGTPEEGFRRLGDALEEMDRSAGENGGEVTGQDGGLPENEMVCSSARIEELAREEGCIRSVPLEACEGLVSMEYAYLYPPGIPVIVPGERISRESVEMLLTSRSQGFSLEGMEEEGSIRVWNNG